MEKKAAEPWQHVHKCSGSLVDKNWVMTAPACVEGNIENLLVVAGAADLRAGLLLKQTREVAEKHIQTNINSHLALIRLKTPLDFGASVNATVLTDSAGKVIDDPREMKALGWGHPGSGLVERLRIITVNENKQTCQSLIPMQLCWVVSYPGVCQGDVGGALIYPALNSANQIIYVQIGVIAPYVDSCASKNDQAHFLWLRTRCDWIARIVGHKGQGKLVFSPQYTQVE
ncbi:unnamed protein product, partial [Mesorhabditis spiculigera]